MAQLIKTFRLLGEISTVLVISVGLQLTAQAQVKAQAIEENKILHKLQSQMRSQVQAQEQRQEQRQEQTKSSELVDPTRPPASILQAGTGLQMPVGPVLQSVLIAPNRKLAIIDGQTVKLNARFGNQILVKITETSVVLKRGKQLQTLSLHPEFSKKLTQSALPAK